MVKKYFFELIKVAVGKLTALSGVPTPNEWQEIFLFAKQQTLVGILFGAVEQLPAEQRPPRPMLLKWFAATEQIKLQNVKVCEDAVEICKRFQQDGFRSVVMKGQSIATYYPQPELRTSGDIDLWVEGGMKKVLAYLRTQDEVEDVSYHHAHYEAPVDTTVEVHYRPSYLYNPLFNRRMQSFFKQQGETVFANSVKLTDGSLLPAPTVEFNRYYILNHIYRHYFGEGIGLRQMLDYYYVLCKGGSAESMKRTYDMFVRTGMKRFVGATMWVMQEVFGMNECYMLCPPDEKAGKRLLNEILIAGNFGKYDLNFDRTNYHSLLPRLWNSLKRKSRFFFEYPAELIFDVPFRTWHYIWRKTM